MDIKNTQPITDTEKMQLMADLIAYLLYDRREETEVRNAFAQLVQERHHNFHDKDDDIVTDFTECGNEICVLGLKMLQSARAARIELNEFSIQLVANMKVKYLQIGKGCVASLEDREEAVAEDLSKGIELA